MKTLDAFIDAHKLDATITTTSLVEIGGATTLRFTNFATGLTWGGETFLRKSFALSEIVVDSSGQQAAELTFNDQDQTLKQQALVADFRERPITIWEAWIDPAAVPDVNGNLPVAGAEIRLVGRTDGIRCAEAGQNAKASIPILASRSPEQSLGPRQLYSASCRYRFKDGQCGYSGVETSCDKTLQRCTQLANQARFGGFPYIPAPGTVLAWGATVQELKQRKFSGD